MTMIVQHIDRFVSSIKRHISLRTKQILWFVALWCLGLMTVMGVSYGLKFILNFVYAA